MTDILMPALSPTMEEGTLAKWHVKVGDEVSAGQVIAEIETDKATMEVEAVDEGVVEEILVAAGTEGVKVNAPIARLKGEGGAAPAPKAAPVAEKAAETQKAETKQTEAAKAAPAPVAASGSRVAASPLARRLAGMHNLDLKGVTRADSAGLACVLALLAQASRNKQRLDVIDPPEGLRALAEVCDADGLICDRP